MTTIAPDQLPDLSFESTTAHWQGTLTPCASAWSNDQGDTVLESTPLKDVPWATLFAYMHRRFGPPHVNGDDYKDLAGGWMLTTPDESVFARVSPCLSGASFSFIPYCVKPAQSAPRFGNLQLTPERIEAVKAAYRATLMDLLRPVGVRDRLFNAMGELGDSELEQVLEVGDGDGEDESPYIAKRHASSCWGMPLGLFGGEDWGALCNIIGALGHGDHQSGRAAAIAVLRGHVFEEAAKQSKAVKRLMLFDHYVPREALAEGLRLSAEEATEFVADLTALSSPEARQSDLVDQLSLDDAKLATQFLKALGMGGNWLQAQVTDLKIDRAVFLAFGALVSLADRDFPEQAVDAVSCGSGPDLAAHMRATFESLGRQDLIHWLASTLALPYGAQVANRIGLHLQQRAKESASVVEEEGASLT